MPSLTFLGAARTVTGSKHLLEVDGQRILFDCGLFQGLKELRLRNWSPLPIPPETIDAVVLTHAHIDHSGWLPRLVAQGFKGPVYCTGGTLDLCRLVLPDAAHLQEEDAKFANKRGFSKHHPALPLYTEEDAAEALSRFRVADFGKKIEVVKGIEIEFINAGHLLGSSYVLVTRTDKSGGRILFGGDLGRYSRPILPDPSPGVDADVLLVESTYGDRLHPAEDDGETLARIIKETFARRGKVIVPAFAIGRVEELLYWLFKLEDEGRLEKVPIYVDSPMAIKGIAYYDARTDELDKEIVSDAAQAAAVHVGEFGARIEGAGRARRAGRDHRVERHGHRRTRRAPPVCRLARPAKHRALRRIPGRRHARPAAGRRRPAREDLRTTGARSTPE